MFVGEGVVVVDTVEHNEGSLVLVEALDFVVFFANAHVAHGGVFGQAELLLHTIVGPHGHVGEGGAIAFALVGDAVNILRHERYERAIGAQEVEAVAGGSPQAHEGQAGCE